MSAMLLPDEYLAWRTFLRGEASQVRPEAALYVTELRTNEITTAGWIDFFLPDVNALPRAAIRIQPAGGLGPMHPGYTRRRVQFDCYGVTAAQAHRIATLVMLAAKPPEGNAQGFEANNARVVNMLEVTGPLPGVDPDTGAPYRTVTIDFKMLEIAAGVAA